MEINIVCILGAGTLGSRIALQAALSGYSVRVFDIHEQALESVWTVRRWPGQPFAIAISVGIGVAGRLVRRL
jgi:NADPH-dependent 2,4-dienoyl-CoA reductase/sulfur reductase-like enzyme